MSRIIEHNETFSGKPISYDAVNSTISPLGSIRYTRIYIHNGTAWIEDAQRIISAKGIMTNV